MISALVAEYFGGPRGGLGGADLDVGRDERLRLRVGVRRSPRSIARAPLLPRDARCSSGCVQRARPAGATTPLTHRPPGPPGGTSTTARTRTRTRKDRHDTQHTSRSSRPARSPSRRRSSSPPAPAGGERRRRPTATPTPATSPRSSCSCSGCRRRQFAGYFAAQEQGYFEEEGLDVEIIPSGGDIVPQDALANGDVDFAIAWVPKVLGSIEAGRRTSPTSRRSSRGRAPCRCRGPTRASSRSPTSRARRSARGASATSGRSSRPWPPRASTRRPSQIITQDFNMNAFLQGDIDAAQAMTYNEYAQLLEASNPDTGELYQPEDFNVISYEDTEGAMLQDAIWADTERLESDEDVRRTRRSSSSRPSSRAGSTPRDNPEEAAEITIAAGSGWGPSHELWMMNEINKLIWPSPNGIGVIDEAAWDKTVDGRARGRQRGRARTSSPRSRRRPPGRTSRSRRRSTSSRTRTSTSPARASRRSTSPSRRAATSTAGSPRGRRVPAGPLDRLRNTAPPS